jgi:uncharacterized protein (DUF885 family)
MKRLAFALLLLVAGCVRLSQSSAPPASEADTHFARLADEYLDGYLAWRPQSGTALGFHQYDGKITDFSQRSLDAELARLRSFDSKLAALDATKLSPQSSRDYRLLGAAVRRELFSFEDMQIYARNPMTYAGALDVNIYIKRDFAPLETRVRSITAILERAPDIFAAARANLEPVVARPLIETAVEQANGAADFLSKDLVTALKVVKDEKLMAEFNAVNEKAIAELRNFATYLKEQKLPAANDNFALGREKYIKLLASGEMVTIPPEQLLEIGMHELRRNQELFAEAAKIISPEKTAVAVYQSIQKEHPTEQSLIPDTARNLEMIRQFVIDHHIITIPSPVRARVFETPQYMRATSFASMDTPGPFETKATEAYYYVTPTEPDWTPQQKEEWLTAFNYYDTDVTSIHEAYPGHYVQFLCLNASPANKVEKIFGSYAFIEGWAHYTEQMMLDEGFGAGGSSADAAARVRAAKYRVAQVDEALLRLCRLCVSLQMHCQGMTVDQGTKFFQDNCYYEPKPARQEAVRGTFDPEYLYYTVGKLEILKLREDYRKQEGAGFSLQKFHDEMLRHGAPPLRLLREAMLKDPKQWDQML